MSWWYLQGIHFQNGRPFYLKCWSNIPIFHLYGLRVWEKCLISLGSWVRWQLTRRRSASWLPLNVSHVHKHPLTAQIQTISSHKSWRRHGFENCFSGEVWALKHKEQLKEVCEACRPTSVEPCLLIRWGNRPGLWLLQAESHLSPWQQTPLNKRNSFVDLLWNIACFHMAVLSPPLIAPGPQIPITRWSMAPMHFKVEKLTDGLPVRNPLELCGFRLRRCLSNTPSAGETKLEKQTTWIVFRGSEENVYLLLIPYVLITHSFKYMVFISFLTKDMCDICV